MPSLPDTLRVLLVWFIYMGQMEFIRTIWLLYCDQLHLQFSNNILGYFNGYEFELMKHKFPN